MSSLPNIAHVAPPPVKRSASAARLLQQLDLGVAAKSSGPGIRPAGVVTARPASHATAKRPHGPVPVPGGANISPKLEAVANALGGLTQENQSWEAAREKLLAIAKDTDAPLADVLQRVGNHLVQAKESFNQLEDFGLKSLTARGWNPGAEHRVKLEDIQRRLAAFLASVQDLRAQLGEIIDSKPLDKLECEVAARLLKILPLLLVFASQDTAASPPMEPLYAALQESASDPGKIRKCLAALSGRRNAVARFVDHAMALRDAACAPSILDTCRAKGADGQLLKAMLLDVRERTAWGPASLIAASSSPADLETGAVADSLRAFRRSRQLESNIAGLLGGPECDSQSLALYKMLDRMQELIGNFKGAAAKLADAGFAERDGESNFARCAVADVERSVTTWQAIADDLIRLVTTLPQPGAGRVPIDVTTKAVDRYLEHLDRGATGGAGKAAMSLHEIEKNLHNEFTEAEGRALVASEPKNKASRSAKRKTARKDKDASNASRRLTTNDSPDQPSLDASPPRVSADTIAEARILSQVHLSAARNELEAKFPQRRTVEHFLGMGTACLAKAGLATDGFVSEGEQLLREVAKKQWSVWPTQELYLALKDDIEVKQGIENCKIAPISDTGWPRIPGESVDRAVLRLKGSTDQRDWAVMHVHKFPGIGGRLVAHFKLYREEYKTSRDKDRIHRGLIFKLSVVQDILARAGKRDAEPGAQRLWT